MDKLKLGLALLVLGGAVVAFYLYQDESTLLRVVGLLAATGISLAIASQTEPGRATLSLLQETRTEVRKVVWPTRQETMQTTLAVFLIVLVLGVFLWLLDMFLLWAIQALTGQGGG